MLKASEKELIEAVLNMPTGYVSDFTDRSFSEFFHSLGVDIDADAFAVDGTSKARRFRVFLRTAPPEQIAAALSGMLGHLLRRSSRPDDAQIERFRRIVERLEHLARESKSTAQPRITEVTRRALIDELNLSGLHWAGRMQEAEFLTRLFDLEALPSHDSRHVTMAGDLLQHRVANLDWDDDWVFGDSRLRLAYSDEALLRFLCEMVHPAVRPERTEVDTLIQIFNRHLSPDGWVISPSGAISGRPVFAARRISVRVELPASPDREVLSNLYVQELATKCDDRLLAGDLDGAVTSSRTMLEAVLFELEERLLGSRSDFQGDLQKHFKLVAKQLRMDTDREDLEDNFKQVIRGLVQIVNGLAPIRNKMSDGHARQQRPLRHHAQVVVNAAKTVATFLVDSYLAQKQRGLLARV